MASPHKHLKRYRQIAGVLADEGLGTVLDVTGLRRFARLRSRILGRARTRVSDIAGIEVRVRRTLERLGPTAVKLGQLMSSRADLLPESLVLELRKLQDEVPPVSFERIRPVLERELGGPVSEFFA
jgi:ubiquinone biosynthesis protein